MHSRRLSQNSPASTLRDYVIVTQISPVSIIAHPTCISTSIACDSLSGHKPSNRDPPLMRKSLCYLPCSRHRWPLNTHQKVRPKPTPPPQQTCYPPCNHRHPLKGKCLSCHSRTFRNILRRCFLRCIRKSLNLRLWAIPPTCHILAIPSLLPARAWFPRRQRPCIRHLHHPYCQLFDCGVL